MILEYAPYFWAMLGGTLILGTIFWYDGRPNPSMALVVIAFTLGMLLLAIGWWGVIALYLRHLLLGLFS